MPISTANLLANTADPKLARVDLLAAVVLLNDLVVPGFSAKAGSLIPFDPAVTVYTVGSIAKNLADTINPQTAAGVIAGADTFTGSQAGIKKFTFAQVLTFISTQFKLAINVFTKNQSVVPVALVDAANIATDASSSNNFRVTLTATRILDNPTNLTDGMVLNWKIINGGAFNLTYGSKFKWDGGTAPTLTLGAGKVDLISGIYYADDGFILCAMGKDKR